ncbi:MAG: hypothetical protein JXA98_02665 [Methanosarcinaceae archaeon]|nr:hypothetical protein [Methanosarcinaceae archaeon]
MADCELLVRCPFFNDMDDPMRKIYTTKYCQSDNTKCARHMVFEALGRERVPLDLFPYMYDEAKMIISEK